MDTTKDKELGVLKTVLEREEVHQRDIADIVGMSVGMANAIVKRLSKKGLLTVRKVNNRKIRYAVTPAGVDEIAKRTYRYLKSTIKSVVDYKEAVGQVVRRAAREGYTGILLMGKSDIDFIVEHQCHTHGLTYQYRKGGGKDGAGATEPTAPDGAAAGALHGTFVIYSEQYETGAELPPTPREHADGTQSRRPKRASPAQADLEGAAYLRQVLVSG